MDDQLPAVVGELVAAALRALPFLRDEASNYEDDGSNEPLETVRDIEAAVERINQWSHGEPASLKRERGATCVNTPHASPKRSADPAGPTISADAKASAAACNALTRLGYLWDGQGWVAPSVKVLCHRKHQPNYSSEWISGDYSGPESTQRGWSIERAYSLVGSDATAMKAHGYMQELEAAKAELASLRTLSALTAEAGKGEEENEFFPIPAGLHPHTVNLVARFAAALADKLAMAERKYGYSDGWASPDWLDECRAKLVEHVAKGDPRDVAAYCAFLWHHNERTALSTATPAGEWVIPTSLHEKDAPPFWRKHSLAYSAGWEGCRQAMLAASPRGASAGEG